jgi:hypothetical protein
MFPDLTHCDPGDSDMQRLDAKFDRELRELAISFLKRHADKVTKKALLGFVETGTSSLTFDRIFEEDV